MSDQCLDVVFHDRGQSVCGPRAIDHPVAELRIPHQVVASQILPMIFGDVNGHLPTREVEDTLFGLRGEELHVICRCDLPEDVRVVEDGLV